MPRRRRPHLSVRLAGLVLGPALFGFIYFFFKPAGASPLTGPMAAIVALMAVWWITEAIPLAATSLLPFVLMPLTGIMTGKAVAPYYMNSTILLLTGGFLIALAMERRGLHRRIALWVLSVFGENPAFILMGFMLACAGLSMWISNTATAVMMLPIALSIIARLEGQGSPGRSAKAILLGIAYACSVGGIITPIGTPPNLIYRRFLEQQFPAAPVPGFLEWMTAALPAAMVMLVVIWAFLYLRYIRGENHAAKNNQGKHAAGVIREELRKLGPMRYEEKMVALVFVLTAILWMSRADLKLGALVIPGWSALLGTGKFLDDGVTAIFMALILFLIPAGPDPETGRRGGILDATVFKDLPWSIILLFGGGFAMAAGFARSGLADYLTSGFTALGGLHPLLLVFVIALGVTFLTEFTSNTASSQLLLPVLASLAIAIKVNPMLLMLPAVYSASMAFMMPVATPPNAIVFGSEKIKIAEMARAGFLLNITGAMVISTCVYFVVVLVFDIDLNTFPEWAVKK